MYTCGYEFILSCWEEHSRVTDLIDNRRYNSYPSGHALSLRAGDEFGRGLPGIWHYRCQTHSFQRAERWLCRSANNEGLVASYHVLSSISRNWGGLYYNVHCCYLKLHHTYKERTGSSHSVTLLNIKGCESCRLISQSINYIFYRNGLSF